MMAAEAKRISFLINEINIHRKVIFLSFSSRVFYIVDKQLIYSNFLQDYFRHVIKTLVKV